MTLKLNLKFNWVANRLSLRVTTTVVLLMFLWMAVLPSESARSGEAVCRHYNHHEICVLSIKRSAKNYWEYLASVRVDGVKRPIERYDCRNRDRARNNTPKVEHQSKNPVSLNHSEISTFICAFFK